MKVFKGRALVPGKAKGKAVVVDTISFYGDVDPKTGILKDAGTSLKGKILVARTSRGSTVGSYIIYSLKENDVAPLAILMERAEPIVVVGCVLAEIPLIDSLPPNFFKAIKNGITLSVVEDGTVEILGDKES